MSVAGTYNVTVKSPMGDQTGTFTVVPAGSSFTGSLVGSLGSMEIADGKLDGNNLAWSMDMTMPMPMTLECEATVTGDALSGSVKAGVFGSMALSGTRAG